MRVITVGPGGAQATVATSSQPSWCASGALAISVSTVGAPSRCVTRSSSKSFQITSARTARRHTCVPPIAVTAQGVHQPLQWNIGSVHR